jgi:glycosyltransferase involved in cell wall biosynthesis
MSLEAGPLPKGLPQPKSVLCCTGTSLSPALELVCKAIEAVTPITDVTLIVNFHPSTDTTFQETLRDRATTLAGAAGSRLEFCTEGIQQLLPRIAVVLYNVSGSALEGLAGGVPAIFVASDYDIDFDTINDPDLAPACRTSAELRDAIIAALATGIACERRLTEIRRKLRRIYGCVDPAAWRNLVSRHLAPRTAT